MDASRIRVTEQKVVETDHAYAIGSPKHITIVAVKAVLEFTSGSGPGSSTVWASRTGM